MNSFSSDELHTLYQRLGDSRKGYQFAAERVDSGQYTELFKMRSEERRVFADRVLRAFGEKNVPQDAAEDESTLTGAAHRVWTDVVAAVGDTDEAVAKEVARGEKALIDQYDTVLEDGDQTDPLYTELLRQQTEVKRVVTAMPD